MFWVDVYRKKYFKVFFSFCDTPVVRDVRHMHNTVRFNVAIDSLFVVEDELLIVILKLLSNSSMGIISWSGRNAPIWI